MADVPHSIPRIRAHDLEPCSFCGGFLGSVFRLIEVRIGVLIEEGETEVVAGRDWSQAIIYGEDPLAPVPLFMCVRCTGRVGTVGGVINSFETVVSGVLHRRHEKAHAQAIQRQNAEMRKLKAPPPKKPSHRNSAEGVHGA